MRVVGKIRREDAFAACFCLVAAAVILMFCSMNSWLYPVNPWVDVNIIATVGRGMLHGAVPYRDLFDHKGPLAFLVFGLGTEMVPGTYHGLYLFEVLCVAGAMFLGWKTARLYFPELSVGWMAPLCAIFAGSALFCEGGSAEEFMLLPVAWSLYDLLRHWRKDRPMKLRTLLLNGFLAGCILWSKFNLLSFHFVWMAAVALDTLIREKKLGRSVVMCLTFLAGMALASAPWLVYFGANGALREMVHDYFVVNLFGYGGSAPGAFLKNMALGAVYVGQHGVIYSVLLALGAAAVLLMPREEMRVREKVTLAGMAVLVMASMFGRGMRNSYYAVMLAVFLPFALLWLGRERMRALPRWTWCAALAVCVGLSFAGQERFRNIGVPYEETPQGQMAKQVREDGLQDATMLQYRSMDMGVYFATGVRPANRWFTFMNINSQECMDRIQELVDAGAADYLVCGAWSDEDILDLEKYEKELVIHSDYGRRKGEDMTYCLYRRKEE